MAKRPEPWAREGRGWYTTIDGKQIPLAKGKDLAGLKKAAFKEFHKLMVEYDKGKLAPSLTAQVVFDSFLEWVESERKPLTLEWYRRHVESFCAHVGKTIAAVEIRPYHVTAWLDAHKWNATTRHGAITGLKAALGWAKKQGHIDVNPLADMAKPTPLAREKILEAEQTEAIFATVRDEAFADFLAALQETGMRPSEAMGLEAGMIDFAARTIRTTGKGRARVVFLTDKALELFAKLAARWPEGPILRNTKGLPWTRNATACRFARLRAKGELNLGSEATAESFRHGFATDALERGVPIASVAELMGHKSTRMVERHYSKLRDRHEHLHEAVQKVRPKGGGKPPAT